MEYIAIFLTGLIAGFIICFSIIKQGDSYIIRKNKIKNSKDISQSVTVPKEKKKFRLFKKRIKAKK